MAVQQHVLNWLYSVLTSEYQDVNRTYNDVSQALSYFPSLSPRTDVHTFPNGASALLLHLSGTIPAVFRGATYRYPISLWVPHNYPREAPLVYVTPTETMMVRPGQHVDPQGQVYHPYLAGWAEFWDKSTIGDFLTILRDVFAKEPPVIARQTPRAQPPPQASSPTPPPQELATSTFSPPNHSQPQQQQQQQQPPPPPPKGNGQPQHGSANRMPSPPPVPPHPSSRSNSAYPTAQATPSPPPVPPHPSSAAAGGAVRSSWYAASSAPPQAVVEAGPSAARSNGAPPVPGRPPYQQSPLGQPPMSPSQQHQHPPYGAYGQTSSPPPPQQSPPTGYGQQAEAAYYQHPQQQQQPQQGYPQQPQQQQQQQQSLPQWQQQQPQQQPPYQQYSQQQQYQQQQQFQPFQQPPPPQQQQHTQAPRPRQPPPPDIMDEPVQSSSNENEPGRIGAAGAVGAARQGHAGGPSASGAAGGAPPPVPPNPEKDALLHQLAQTLAMLRQQSRSKNDASMAGLQAQRAAMLTAFGRLQQDMADVAQLSALLTSNTDILHESLAAADNVVASSKQTPAPAVDDLLVGPTVVANQLYDLVAEERALADAVFMLGRAVERGRVSPAVFAKMTRSLAREWYLKKALVRKVGRGMGLASA
ncbi:Suppressor protein stp22 of temperature-sensitive alpha-factor receptor and arginine permease [Sporothrix curviconia]|uniref:Suppressor protein stp22 of temperature-sensitive alpha-factor receptor and arginine permease n=1 Tax=Sporothrix curviconia TaxID=1260050 RepID=A0ABP0B9G0_9PEZI